MSLKKIYKTGDFIDFKHDAREWKITKVGVKWLHLKNDHLGLITKVLGTDSHYSHRKNKEDVAVKHHNEKMKIKIFNAMKHFKNEEEVEEIPEDEPKEKHKIGDYPEIDALFGVGKKEKVDEESDDEDDEYYKDEYYKLREFSYKDDLPNEKRLIIRDEGIRRRELFDKSIKKYDGINSRSIWKNYPIYIINSNLKFKYIKKDEILDIKNNVKRRIRFYDIDVDRTLNNQNKSVNINKRIKYDTTLIVSHEDAKEYFNISSKALNAYSYDENSIIIQVSSKKSGDVTFDVYWRLQDRHSIKGVLRNINTSSAFASNLSYWEMPDED
jgi:hypothetical protein